MALFTLHPPPPIPITSDPIGYSYGGVVLPELPEYDKEQYPYAFMAYANGEAFGDPNGYAATVYVLSGALLFEDNGLATDSSCLYKQFAFTNSQILADLLTSSYSANVSVGDWCLVDEGDDYTWCDVEGSVVNWTNTDILNTDGSTYLSASNPIPVYGTVATDSTIATQDGGTLYIENTNATLDGTTLEVT